MRTFTFYIRDSRYKVPTVAFVTVSSEALAREIAADRLAQSTFHTGVDVFEGEEKLFTVRRNGVAPHVGPDT